MALPPLLALFSPLAGQRPARLAAGDGTLPPRLAARVTAAVARAWGVDTTGLVLNWGSGPLATLPDSSAFRLLGAGEGGWFAVSFEPPDHPVVAVRLRAGRTELRPVAARPLRAGLTLAAADIRFEPHVAWGPPALAADPEGSPAAGWLVKRTLREGEALLPPRVVPPPVIAAGQPVRLQWAEGNVSVVLEGTALNDAVVGETVRVRTGRRTGVLLGTVTAPGEARMP